MCQNRIERCPLGKKDFSRGLFFILNYYRVENLWFSALLLWQNSKKINLLKLIFNLGFLNCKR